MSFPNSTIFDNEQTGNSRYWSANEAEVIPACRITTLDAQDVSTAVTELIGLKCPFAVRGGGHMWWAGAANIQGGVTIDLSAMNQIQLSQDQKITAVGPGARWADVYTQLNPKNLSVVGGRVGTVGVAGLTLGGT